ncbi:MAG: citrate synthase [Actinomycetota bacterium]
MTEPDGPTGLTTSEAAELLGVKPQTIYAYVSRGILHRQVALDGRTSVFDRAEVEQLRLGRHPERAGEQRTIVATRLTRVSDEGIWIRGHDLIAAVSDGAGFTDIADLLWDTPPDEHWAMPTARPADDRPGSADRDPDADRPRFDAVGGWPSLGPLDQFRVVLATESAADPLRHDLTPRSVRAAGRRAIMAMATGLRTPGVDPAAVDPTGSSPAREAGTIGGLIWDRLSADPATPAKRRALDTALALLADHGLAGSTFAARIAASVRADPYAVVGAGLGVVSGVLHGAASGAVHDLYATAESTGNVAGVVGDRLRRAGRAPGFGHAVYRVQDPRYGLLMTQIIEGWAEDSRLRTVFRVRDVIAERSDAVPNIDLALGALTYLADMPPHGGEAVFAVARTAGWLAHAMEEYEEKPLRFRPRARYIGPAAGS